MSTHRHQMGKAGGHGGGGGSSSGAAADTPLSASSSSASSPYAHSPSSPATSYATTSNTTSSLPSSLSNQLHARGSLTHAPAAGLGSPSPPALLPGQSQYPPSSPAATSSILPLRRGVPPIPHAPLSVGECQYNTLLLGGVLPFETCVLGIYSELLAIVVRTVCIEQHKSARLGRLCLSCKHSCSDPLDEGGLDIFGQPVRKSGSAAMEKLMTLKCVNCSWTVAPSRYAPHLEKCMGLGRNSSRLASQRLQNISSSSSSSSSSSEPSRNAGMDVADDSDDEEYTEGGDNRRSSKSKSKKKKKKDPPPAMTRAKLEHLLATTCGVMSTSTGLMCSKSINCPAHTPEQRARVRDTLLNPTLPDMSDTKLSSSTTSASTASSAESTSGGAPSAMSAAASPNPRAPYAVASAASAKGSAPLDLTSDSNAMEVEDVTPSGGGVAARNSAVEPMVYVDIDGDDEDQQMDVRKKGGSKR
eukprot:TRINITY_DN2120_c0_g2_i1.p1 TRINITY_DN2120_c0_g2~~TRINITY_DN2120_c0_g2_i1.p1  ORF type:complete len:472 (+),score=139.82 TRINITY_DN2120_c0_g2_i1:153-1568(+)